jgi:glycosyltransferase involved in cell wall biosynthesis
VEGFGIPIIEALFSRCPVITNRNGVFPEAGGPDSWYVNPREPEEIRTAIRSILDDPQETASRTERGLAYARKQFEPHQLIDQLSGHYKELLSN